MADHDTFQHPLVGRYAAKEMRRLFGQQKRIGLWRRLWVALAEAEQELGLTQITDEALKQMRAHLDDIDFTKAADYEKQFRHDVMAHVHTFGDVAPAAKAVRTSLIWASVRGRVLYGSRSASSAVCPRA